MSAQFTPKVHPRMFSHLISMPGIRDPHARHLPDNHQVTHIRVFHRVHPNISNPLKDSALAGIPKRHKAGRAALGLSCGACFEQLAGVSASRVASRAGPPPKSGTGCRNQQQRNRLPLKQLR